MDSLADGKDIKLRVGGKFTTSTRAYDVISWTGCFYVFELNAAQARAAGLARSGAIFNDFGGASLVTRVSPPSFALENLQVDARNSLTGAKEMSGSVTGRALVKATPPRLLPRVSLRLAKDDSPSVATPVEAIPRDGVLRFTIAPINARDVKEPHFGPTPLFVELIAAKDDIAKNPVVSNPLAELLVVQPDLDTYARSAVRVLEQMCEIPATIRDREAVHRASLDSRIHSTSRSS